MALKSIWEDNAFEGEHYYLAPEVVNGTKYSEEADVWALGILLLEIGKLDDKLKYDP